MSRVFEQYAKQEAEKRDLHRACKLYATGKHDISELAELLAWLLLCSVKPVAYSKHNLAKRGDAEMLDMLTSVFDEEEAQRIHIDKLLKEERLNTIVSTCLNVGLSDEIILQQLIKQGHLDRTSAEMFLHSYTDVVNK